MFYYYYIYHQDILAWKQTKLKWMSVDYDKVIGISLYLNRLKKRKLLWAQTFSQLFCVAHSSRTGYFGPIFKQVRSRSDKFNYIVQIKGQELLKLLSTNILMLFFKIWYFSSVQVFSFCNATFRDSPEILSFKGGAFWRNSVIIDFLEINRYSAKRSMQWFVSLQGLPNFEIRAKLIFQLLPPNVRPLVTFALK